MSEEELPYIAVGDKKLAEAEYEKFCGSVAQLLDEKTMIGDIEGRWVIFKDGWVFGMATYACESDAVSFAKQIFRDEPAPSYIITKVDLNEHDISPLMVLASAFSDVDAAKFSAEEEGDEEEEDQE